MLEIWNEYLYRPLFNALIWIYNNWADGNMGWAIVYLTLLLRAALLPFTLIGEYTAAKNADLDADIGRLQKELANDPILQKDEIRRALKKRKISPWSKAMTLGIQGLVLVLLYQVFVSGIAGERILQMLYKSVHYPGNINTIFFGFHLEARHDIFWSGLVMIFLMLEIYFGFRKHKDQLNRADLAFFVLFPVAVFITLYVLPMVKALFILVSMLFSMVVHQISVALFRRSREKRLKEAEEEADEKKGKTSTA